MMEAAMAERWPPWVKSGTKSGGHAALFVPLSASGGTD